MLIENTLDKLKTNSKFRLLYKILEQYDDVVLEITTLINDFISDPYYYEKDLQEDTIVTLTNHFFTHLENLGVVVEGELIDQLYAIDALDIKKYDSSILGPMSEVLELPDILDRDIFTQILHDVLNIYIDVEITGEEYREALLKDIQDRLTRLEIQNFIEERNVNENTN
jgi:hypothetical protein